MNQEEIPTSPESIIIDLHSHIGLSVDGAEGKEEEFLSILKKCGISRAVIFPIDSEDRGETYEKPNDLILSAAERHPDQFIPFCRVQPKAGRKALKELERCLKRGAQGLKLHPRSDHFTLEESWDVFDEAARLNCPVILHTEHGEYRHPDYWKDVFEKHADINFILAHAGKDAFRKAGALAKTYANVYLDTSTLSYDRTRVLLKMVGPEKIVFASDYPYSRPELEKMKWYLLVSDESERRKIFFENPRNILK